MPNEGLSLRELRPLELSPAYGENESYWPLESRGWVFQERLLSPRTLIFSRDQVILVNEWHRLVINYARLQLTYHEDRLPAIAALMGQMYRLRGNDVYIAGLWKSSLILDLQWHKPNLSFGQFSESSQPRLSLPVPTWLGASVPGHISYIHASAELSSISKLLDLSFIPVGPANFGYVTDVSIALEGPVATAVRKPSKGIFTSQKSSYEIPGLHTDLIRSYPDFDLPKDNKAARISLKVIFLSRNRYDAVEEFSGLVLLEAEHKAYKRDGFVKLRASSYDGDEGKLRELREYVASLPIGCATII
ncbi:hypothetical protein E8E12_010155 [Didymella heteroderae]|uniref:Uncharacterized protein n=1 Tax=Didymella heteroderae TaxID=1769908 RepID=A0A9P4X1K6_9PLEO|nr:hypothetical protein E8E12_010155 [Didymella heteroderae]